MAYFNRAERENFLLLIAAKTAISIAAGMPKFKVEGGVVLAQTAIDAIDLWSELILKDYPPEVRHSLFSTAKESRMRLVGHHRGIIRNFLSTKTFSGKQKHTEISVLFSFFIAFLFG